MLSLARELGSQVSQGREGLIEAHCHIFRRSVGSGGGKSSNLVSLPSALFVSTTAVDIRRLFERFALDAAVLVLR
jgi:hypothetical protein